MAFLNSTPVVNWRHRLGSISGDSGVEVLHLLMLARGF